MIKGKKVNGIWSNLKRLYDPLIGISAIIFVILAIIIHSTYLDMLKSSPESPYVDLLVEAHGLLFDIFLFSIILALYNNWYERKRNIKRHKEELEDYSGWEEEEASHRLVGIIKRLSNQGANSLTLSRCNLARQHLSSINLTNSDILECNFNSSSFFYVNFNNSHFESLDISKATFSLCDFTNTSLTECSFSESFFQHNKFISFMMFRVNFTSCEFNSAKFYSGKLSDSSFNSMELKRPVFYKCDLRTCYFYDCNFLYDTNFDDSRVSGFDWFDKLKERGNSGIDIIKDKYRIIQVDKKTNTFLLKRKLLYVKRFATSVPALEKGIRQGLETSD